MPFLPSRRANSLTHRSGTKSIRNSHRTVILFMTLPSPHQFKTLFIFSIQPPSSEPFTISQPFRTYLLLYLLFPFSLSLLVILRSRSYLLPMRNSISHTAKDITNNINRITEFCFSAQSSHHPSNLSHPCSYSYQALLQTQQSNTIGRTGPCLLSALCISVPVVEPDNSFLLLPSHFQPALLVVHTDIVPLYFHSSDISPVPINGLFLYGRRCSQPH